MKSFRNYSLNFFIGIYCQEDYDACESPGACKIYWNANTTCISLNATEQIIQNRSYTCDGTCETGFNSTDGFTCSGKKNLILFDKKKLILIILFLDINECLNASICQNGICINTIGSYTCNCSIGYEYNNVTCVGKVSYFILNNNSLFFQLKI
jgi:hypothetical protein